jgi:type IV secretion system protein TrbL
MATASPSGLDLFLNNFRTQVDSGFGLISGDVQGVLATLVVISIVTTAILWAIDENQNVLASLVRKVLLIGFFAWLVTQWHTLSVTVVEGFTSLGLRAGGGAMTLGDFLNSPSKIVMKGIQVCIALFDYIHRLAPGPVEFFAHLDAILMALIACIGVLIAFVLLAIEVTVVVIEFHIVTLIAFVTVPFGILTQTSFLSERAIGYVVSVGIKLMALAIVVSIGANIFNSYTVSTAPDIYEEVGLLLAAVVLLMLALKIPAIAGALITGGPQLNAGSAAMGAAGVAAGVAGAGLAMRAVGGAVASGWAAGGSQVAAARSAAGAIPSGGGSGPTPSGGGPGPADFARAPVSSAVSSLRSAGGRLFGGGVAEGGSDDDAPPPPSPADTVARAEARRSGLATAAQTAAATATQGEESGAGMSATPIRPEEPPPGAGT